MAARPSTGRATGPPGKNVAAVPGGVFNATNNTGEGGGGGGGAGSTPGASAASTSGSESPSMGGTREKVASG